MARAVIVDAVRSPMGRGKPTGALAGLHPADLLGQVFAALLGRTGVDPATVDDVLVGCVSQAGERPALLLERYCCLGIIWSARDSEIPTLFIPMMILMIM